MLLSSFRYTRSLGMSPIACGLRFMLMISFKPTCLHSFFKAQNMRSLRTYVMRSLPSQLSIENMTYWHRLGSVFTVSSLGDCSINLWSWRSEAFTDIQHEVWVDPQLKSRVHKIIYIPNKIFVEYFEDWEEILREVLKPRMQLWSFVALQVRFDCRHSE